MTVKTACSSSLVCLDLACQAIRKGDCTSSLVCGVSLIFSPTMSLTLQDQGVLSPSGQCKSFDASADGYGRGEAVNAIYIKRLSDALRDGDNVRAVIRGSSVNDDGRTAGMLTPSPVAQEKLIRRAYQQAGIRDLSRTGFVECHGTGTKVGDPLEVKAVAKCFGTDGVIITSVGFLSNLRFSLKCERADDELGETQRWPFRGCSWPDFRHQGCPVSREEASPSEY